MKLYRQLEARNDQVNLVESPYSVAEALAMLASGAQGRTKYQLDTALSGKGGVVDPVQRAAVRSKLLLTNGSGLGTTVSVSNALWTATGYPLNASYLQTLTTQYAATSAQLPFATDPASAVDTINQWASTSTEGRIPKLVDATTITEVTRVVLTNAVLFHGRWSDQFDPGKTAPARFTLANGKRISVPTMHGNATTSLKGNPRIISLGFNGGYEMRITVPTKSTRASLDTAMTALHQPRAPATGYDTCADVSIALPKWTAKATFDELQPVLAGLGITDAFSENADLSGISPKAKTEGIYVSKIVHVANIDVDESGTVAAATEGFLLGIPSLAISLASQSGGHYATAARVAAELVRRFQERPFREPVLLNVNVPDVAYDDLRGSKVTRLGKRHKAEPVIKSINPRGQTVYWVGAAGAAQDAGDGTDFHALSQNIVSITPLQMDLTRFVQIEPLDDWLQL